MLPANTFYHEIAARRTYVTHEGTAELADYNCHEKSPVGEGTKIAPPVTHVHQPNTLLH